MLRITVSKNSAAAISYYQKGLSRQDYYLDKNQIEGRWRGKAAERLGLKGSVEKIAFARMAENRHPSTNEKITVRDSARRRAGYDYTFSAPKSVSILLGITGDQDLLIAHQQAVKKSMMAIEADMQTQVNIKGKKIYQTTGNIAYAAFDHFTSRPTQVEGSKSLEADPQLHTHCFVFNATYHEDRKRFQAIEEGNVHRSASYYEALYHSHLTAHLRSAGYKIERTEKRWEIRGIKRSTIDKFSNRTLEIEKRAKAELAKTGYLSDKQKNALGEVTRKNKNQLANAEGLQDVWEARLSVAEREDVYAAKGSSSGDDLPDRLPSAAVCVDRAISHHLERKSAVAEKKVLAEALRLGYEHLSPTDIHKAMSKRKDLIKAERNTISFITTKEMLKAEDDMIRFAATGKGTQKPLNSEYVIKQDFLNEDQRKAVRHILQTRDRVTILSGGAGVGKSTLLAEVKSGIEEKGKSIFAFAPSADASRKNLREKGFEGADTIQKFLIDADLQGQTKGQVIMIDEAGMIGAKDMNRIFSVAKMQNARIILSGDHRQHASVQAGDALRLLEEKSGIKVARVSKVVRQRSNPAYKQAVTALAKGQVEAGFKKLDRMGAIVEIEDTKKREEAIATDYIKSVAAKRSAIVISPTHAEGRRINSAIRAKLRKEKRLGKVETFFDTQRNLSFTEAQKVDGKNYRIGLAVQFHQNAPGGLVAGQVYDVTDNQNGQVKLRHPASDDQFDLPLNQASRFQVFEKTKTPIASGEVIRITQNGRTQDSTRINNGQVYTVTGFTPEGDVKLSNGKILDKSYRNLTHGYTRTSHSVQGRDAKDVIIAQSALSFPASSDKQFYVSASRGVETCRIYTDDRQALRKAVSKSGDRVSAQDIRKSSFAGEKRKKLEFYKKQVRDEFKQRKTSTKKPANELPSNRKFRR